MQRAEKASLCNHHRLTKVFEIVSRDGLFKILTKISYPPTLPSIVNSFDADMKGKVVYDGTPFDPYDILSSMK